MTAGLIWLHQNDDQNEFNCSCSLFKLLGLSTKEKLNERNSTDSAAATGEEEEVFDVVDFSLRAGFDHLNMHKLIEFCEKSKLPQKLVGFRPVTVQVNPVHGLKSFLQKLKPEEEVQLYSWMDFCRSIYSALFFKTISAGITARSTIRGDVRIAADEYRRFYEESL